VAQDFEIGTIIELLDDIAIVEVPESDQCHSCGARMICRPAGKERRILRLRNTLHAAVGDRILIEQSDRNQLILAFMQYGLALLAFLITIVLASRFVSKPVLGIPAELLQFGIALVALLGAGLVCRFWAKRTSASDFAVFSMKEICQ
jgi:positive regulator of sigma E activity